MLNGQSSWPLHFAQNASLVLLSLFLLPLDTVILFITYALNLIIPATGTRRRIRRSPGFRPKTVLVTGVGMTKGLVLARHFYQAGHNVVGADFEPQGVPVNGRFSKALRKFYSLSKPNEKDGSVYYVQDLLNVIQKERCDLWVSCSGVASAVEDGQAKEVIERRSKCKAIQYDKETTATLHEKNSFIQYTLSLGLPAPETHDVTSRSAVHKVLHATKTKQYVMKSVGVDDAVRGNMTLLPRRTLSDTYNHVSKIPISDHKPWVLQQYIRGEEYCTHALIVRGQLKSFVACPSSELLMHYEALPATSSLSIAMLKFTSEFAARSGKHMTGHLSFDFLVQEKATEKGIEKTLYPIECNPRAHTAVVLFNGKSEECANAYLTALSTEMNGAANEQMTEVVTPFKPLQYYWIGHDLVALVILPLLQVVMLNASLTEWVRGCIVFVQHVLYWKDGTFERWDPLPWWWLYHVYWPGQFLSCIVQRGKWSRINVSTAKMFVC